jgi:hypothetical protein
MASSTTRLGLRQPAPSDAVDVTADLSNNWGVVDAAVGIAVCTSTTRPSVPYPGQQIRETDTGLSWYWDTTGTPAWVLMNRNIIMVTSTTRPTGSSLFSGLMIYETDTNLVYVYNGAAWILYPRAAIICTSVTRPPTPVVGTLIYETDTSDFVICLAITPSIVWVTLERGYVYGGKDVVHAAVLTATGNNNTEVLINNMDSSAMDLLPNTRYRMHARWAAVPSGAIGTTMAAVTSFMLRIRDTNVSGLIRAEQRVEVLTTVAGTVMHGELTGHYETSVAESGKLWVFTAQRITAVTGPVLTFQGDGTSVRKGMTVVNEGHSGQLTQVTS